jgi:hypothetical protein
LTERRRYILGEVSQPQLASLTIRETLEIAPRVFYDAGFATAVVRAVINFQNGESVRDLFNLYCGRLCIDIKLDMVAGSSATSERGERALEDSRAVGVRFRGSEEAIVLQKCIVERGIVSTQMY